MSQQPASRHVSFLTDENIFPAVTRWLRAQGFDVKDVREAGLAGTSDRLLMKLAQQEQRTIVTFDKDFTNPLLYPLNNHFGVIRIRIHPPLRRDVLHAFEQFFQQFDLGQLKSTVVVLERNGYHVRRSS